MVRKRTLNERSLTRHRVEELISAGARPRPDLSAVFEQTFPNGDQRRPLVYELEGNRYLFVSDETNPKRAGKGDIYPADYFLRFVRQAARAKKD